MIRTQIYLTKQERKYLNLLSQKIGKSQSALIREAIDQFIKAHLKARDDHQAAMEAAKGLWADRKDLSNLTKIRKELDNRLKE